MVLRKIKMFIINKFLNFIFIFSILTISSLTNAVVLTYDVVGEKIKYKTSTNAFFGNAQKTTNWDNIYLRPATSWIPGQLFNVSADGVKNFVGDSGDSFTLDIKLTGIEYSGIRNGSGGFFYQKSPTALGSDNIATYNNSNSIEVNQPGDFHYMMFTSEPSSPSIEPFTSVRPLFIIDDSSLLSKLKGLRSGVYRTTIPVSFKYRVKYLNDLAWSYEQRTVPLHIEIKYLATVLDKITVTGDGVFIPKYSESSATVSSKTSYEIKASGEMPNGISMKFNRNRDYIMRNKLPPINSSSESIAIPYTIKCLNGLPSGGECKSVLLVDNGRYVADERIYVRPVMSTKNIDFKLELSFDTDFKRTGDYDDTFIVMFEVVL